MNNIQVTNLKNGLRVISDYVPSMHSVALGIWAGVGARQEHSKNNGVAHMVEHMLFKGTTTRKAKDIVELIENVGGNMNAYTSREVTSYHCHLLSEDALMALDVLADMYLSSTLPDDEIERERDVILQEIGMCQDTPDDLVFDNFYEAAFKDQAVGAPILGRPKIIQAMDKATLSAYIKQHYIAPNTVISAAGNIEHDTLVEHVEKLFASMPVVQKSAVEKSRYSGGDFRVEKELEQAHFVLGFQGVGRLGKNFYVAQALSQVLGGGMSSRLFQEIREKRGLVYSIFAFHSALQDNGLLGVYAGTDPNKLTEMMPVISEELLKSTHTLCEQEVARVKIQMKAGLLMGRESMMGRADQQAKHVLFHDETYDPEARAARIDQIQLQDIQNLAKTIFSTPATLSALGPLGGLESYRQLSNRMAA
jgi:predicted Zn-dependent peptidase